MYALIQNCNFVFCKITQIEDAFPSILYLTKKFLEGWFSLRWSVTMQMWVRTQPGPCGITCDPGTLPFPNQGVSIS